MTPGPPLGAGAGAHRGSQGLPSSAASQGPPGTQGREERLKADPLKGPLPGYPQAFGAQMDLSRVTHDGQEGGPAWPRAGPASKLDSWTRQAPRDKSGGPCARPRDGGPLQRASGGQGPVTHRDAAPGQLTALSPGHRPTGGQRGVATSPVMRPCPRPQVGSEAAAGARTPGAPSGPGPHCTPCGLLDSVGNAVKRVFLLGFNWLWCCDAPTPKLGQIQEFCNLLERARTSCTGSR